MKARVKKTGEIIDVELNDELSAANWVNSETSEYVFNDEIEFDIERRWRMTNEEKELLLKDLCARLPYGLMVDYPLSDKKRGVARLTEISEDGLVTLDIPSDFPFFDIVEDGLVPYLRPMSSMTEEEKNEWIRLRVDVDKYIVGYEVVVDFYNRNHFDYRMLILDGLAIEAPEGMYDN